MRLTFLVVNAGMNLLRHSSLEKLGLKVRDAVVSVMSPSH